MAKCSKVKVEVVKKVDEDRYILELSPSEAALVKYLTGATSLVGSQDHHNVYNALCEVPFSPRRASVFSVETGSYLPGGIK